MRRIIRLTESDITRIVKKVIMEQKGCPCEDGTESIECCPPKELETVSVRVHKFVLSKTEDGVNFVIYNPATGEFTENGKSGRSWAKIKPNLSKQEVEDWFKRNNIRIKK